MDFKFTSQSIPAVILVEHEEVRDPRGFFAETYREQNFNDAGLPRFVQDNYAQSSRHVLRGLHYQIDPGAVGKLMRCIQGEIFDVAVDIRKGSPDYGKYVAVELTESNRKMLYVPPGFAHGYVVMSDWALVCYKVTGYYSPAHERGIRWDDPAIGIAWPTRQPILSGKDAIAPLLAQADNTFNFRGEFPEGTTTGAVQHLIQRP